MQVRSLGQEDPLEKEIATHARILVWGIPWTEEPHRLQSTGSQKSWTRLSDERATTKMASLRGSENWVQGTTTWLLSLVWRVPVQGERGDEKETGRLSHPRPGPSTGGSRARPSEKGLDVSCSDCTPGSQTQPAAHGHHREQGPRPVMAELPEDRAHGSYNPR